MIYLDNNTQQQECWIPRQDILSGHSGGGGGGSYQEGYNDGVAHQKSLLATTAFTQNGEYTRLNGWSGVSVNVPQTGSTARLEEKTVVISADTTNVNPSIGFDGMSAVTVDAEAYAQQNYDSGFDDGFDDGYSSGSSEGYESGYTEGYQSGSTDGFNSGYTSGETHQKSLLISTAFTENGNYSRENGWSGVSINVDTASTYNSGYTSGYTSGHTDGISEEKAKMSAVTFTANTAVTLSDGSYSAVTVDVPQTGYTQQDLDNAFASGETVGENTIIATFSSTTATTNGEYGSSAHPLSAITVDVPTGTSIPLSSITITANTAVTVVDKAYTGITVNVQQSSDIEPNKSLTATTNGIYTITPTSASTIITDRFDSDRDRYYLTATTIGYPSTGRFELFYIEDEFDSSKGSITVYFDNGALDYDDSDWYGGEVDWDRYGNDELEVVIYDANRDFGWTPLEDFSHNFDVMSAVTLNVNVPTGSSATLGEGSFSANGVYSAITDNLDGYSAITINVPQTGGRKYVEYIETDGTRVGWDTGLKVGSENSSFNIELDFMPLSGTVNDDAFYTFICDASDSDIVNIYGRTFGLGYKINKFNIQLGNLSNTTYNGLSFNNRYNLVYDYESSSGKIILDETTILSSNSVTLQSKSNVKTLHINTWFYQGVVRRCPPARYYKVKITIDGVEHIFNPCLDSNNVPCFYDEYNNSYLYSIGTGNTPTAGPIIPSPEYNSGHTQGMKDALEDSFYGAYYPVDSATSGSYYTVFPTLEEGQKLYFDIVVYTAQNSSLLGNNQGNLYLSMSTSDGVDLRVADSNGLSGATLHSYWLEYYRPNQNPYSRNISRVCGEVSVTSGECKTALDTGGAWLQEIATSGDFSLQYSVTFNTSCVSGLVLNSLVYKDVQTNETIRHYKLNPDTLEMEDYFNDNTVAPTYDKNGNLVSGVLEPRQFRF